ncbi:MAG: hypothetical protein JWN17_1875 [Frankiales bacterium]|nr:hypothetical protein [Frankiales bacterium]
MQPLVVSLVLDPVSQERFDALRRAHFPRDRLQVGAHVSLFHALPGEDEPQVDAALRAAARRQPFDVAVTAVRSLGRGVAFALHADELSALHCGLQQAFQDRLTPQDRQRLSAHVTVQNKVTPDAARRLLAQLAASFTPYVVRAEGLALWRYAGGPWEPRATYPFTGADGAAGAAGAAGSAS